MTELRGTLEKIIFKSPETGFSVFKIKVSSKETITVTGVFPSLNEGEFVSLKGDWAKHSKFGRQFEATECVSKLPASVEGIKKYLASGMIKGIGPKFAEKIVHAFKELTLDIIDEDPNRLYEVHGIGAKRVSIIIEAWKEQKEISKVMVFLQEKGISTGFATKIFKTYGQESISKIKENPYRLIEDIWGVGFKSADAVALKLGFERDSSARVKAGILHVLANESSSGHLYCELDDLKEKTLKILEITDTLSLLKTALNELYSDTKIKLITKASLVKASLTKTSLANDLHYVSLPKHYYSEKGVASKLLNLKKDPVLKFNLDKAHNLIRAEGGITLNDEQQRGIMACLQSKVTIITGGPGTGKTTLIRKLLDVLDDSKTCLGKYKYRLAAPTGRAAKRILEGTGRNAQTIHRLLEFSPMIMDFTKNEQNALDLDFLIVDEASMLDIFLMHSLLRAMPFKGHLVLIGDVDQLPSVGPGNVLKDLIASKVPEVIELKEIFRQAQDSLIITNAHKINNGEFPSSFQEGSRNDFKYIKESDPEKIFGYLKKIYLELLPGKKIKPEDAIVLCPMNRGIAGTMRINQELQSILNPVSNPDKEVSRFGQVYKIKDRVMQIRNNYDKFVFNGDQGFIVDIDRVEQELMIKFGERTLKYDFSEMDEITLSYAISIHKSQGSEFKVVIVSIFMQHFIMLQRNLIYTAISRAKEFCCFIGESRAIAIGIKNNKAVIRNTFLTEFLTSDLEAR